MPSYVGRHRHKWYAQDDKNTFYWCLNCDSYWFTRTGKVYKRWTNDSDDYALHYLETLEKMNPSATLMRIIYEHREQILDGIRQGIYVTITRS